MTDEISELNKIIEKYKNIIEVHETHIADAKLKMNTAYDALKLLQEEKITKQDELFDLPSENITTTLSDKYKKLSMKDAITDIFLNHRDEALSGQDIHEELKKHGYLTKSKNLLRDVYVFLNKTYNAGNIITTTKGKPKRYKLKMLLKPTYNEATQ